MDRENETESDAERDRGVRGATFTARGVSFALVAHPTVQFVRFLSKLALPWFLTPGQFGEATLAGAILFGVQHIAVFGLDEALVSAAHIDSRLYARMRRFQTSIGLALSILVAGVGLLLRFFPDQQRLGLLMIGLSPMTLVANLATLPTALLVRERCYARVFAVDFVAITSFTTVAIVSAALGAGAWSLVLAWHANAIAAMIAATVFAHPLVPRHAEGGEAFELVKDRGAHFTGAAVLGYVGERIDSMTVGFGIGRSVLGLYEAAQNYALVMVTYAASLSERLLFPTLALHHREGGLGRAYLHALRITMLFVFPLHVILAALAVPIVVTIVPAAWHDAAPLLRLLALAAGVRCFDIAAVTALKAAGHGRTVFKLGLVRIALLVIALASSIPFGVVTVAGAVLASRAVTAVISLYIASTRLDLSASRAEGAIPAASGALAAWLLFFVPAACYLPRMLEGASVPQLAVMPLLALLVWLCARSLADRAALSRELALVRVRLDRPPPDEDDRDDRGGPQ
jgi:O-antigen/teichoic acid export membrane protein